MILRFMEGPRTGKTVAINNDDFTIGRDDSCDLLIDEEGVSRLHCRIEKNGDVYVVKDNESTNGVYVNGAKIPEPRTLKQNDTIRVGDTIMLFSTDDSKLDSQTLEAITKVRDEKKEQGGSEQSEDPVPVEKKDAATDENKEKAADPSETQSEKKDDSDDDDDDDDDVQLNFDKGKKTADDEDAPSPLGGSTGILLAIVIILIIIFLWVAFGPTK